VQYHPHNLQGSPSPAISLGRVSLTPNHLTLFSLVSSPHIGSLYLTTRVWSLSDHTLHSHGPRTLRVYVLNRRVILNITNIFKIIVTLDLTIILNILVILNIASILSPVTPAVEAYLSAMYSFPVSLSSHICPPPHTSPPLFSPSIYSSIGHYGPPGIPNSVRHPSRHPNNRSCLSDGASQHRPLRMLDPCSPLTTRIHICSN